MVTKKQVVLNEEEAHQEAIKLFTTLNKETIERICSRIHFNKVFDQLGDLVEFSGHYLEHHLEPGKYIFSFTLFHYKDANVHSMANSGFIHPALSFKLNNIKVFLVFQPIEMKKELLKERITISSKLKSMKYLWMVGNMNVLKRMIVFIFLSRIEILLYKRRKN